MAAGGVGVGGGVGLSTTGVGAVAGVPLGGLSAAGVAFGAGLAGVSGMALAAEASGDDAVEIVDTSATAEPAEPPMPWEDPAVREKIPEEWGEGRANQKGVGQRWEEPGYEGNGIRVDRGDPTVSQPTQQDDHVIVRYRGRVIGRDGQPIPGALNKHPEDAHIPLTEWKQWKSWNHP